jgi:hemolysin III
LLLAADSPRGYVGGAVFGASLVLLFTTSASYHLVPWLPRLRPIARRIDHSMIFVAVAGFYTPFCLQVLGVAWGIPLLVTVWVLAAAGITLKQAWPSAPAWLSLGAYLCIGWVALVALVPLAAGLSPLAMAGLVTSGVLYSVGGVIFATGRPSLAPRVFGHHEVFHSLVAVGSAVLLCVVMTDVLPR